SRRRHTRCLSDWSSDVCSSDLDVARLCPLAAMVDFGVSDTCYCSIGFRGGSAVGQWMVRIGRGRTARYNAYSVGSLPQHAAKSRSEERRVGKECEARCWSEVRK